jgi:hypothetical protein
MGYIAIVDANSGLAADDTPCSFRPHYRSSSTISPAMPVDRVIVSMSTHFFTCRQFPRPDIRLGAWQSVIKVTCDQRPRTGPYDLFTWLATRGSCDVVGPLKGLGSANKSEHTEYEWEEFLRWLSVLQQEEGVRSHRHAGSGQEDICHLRSELTSGN